MTEIIIEANVSKKFDVSIESPCLYTEAYLQIKIDDLNLSIEATEEQLHDLYDTLQEYLNRRGRIE